MGKTLGSNGRFVKVSLGLTKAWIAHANQNSPCFLCFQPPSYLINTSVSRPVVLPFKVFRMSQSPPAPPSLEVLRKEIDSIDAQVHSLLMARGDIIDRLISVKQTQ